MNIIRAQRDLVRMGLLLVEELGLGFYFSRVVQRRTTPDQSALASCAPLSEKTRVERVVECPRSVAVFFPAATSQRWTTPSLPPAARSLPSGLKASRLIESSG